MSVLTVRPVPEIFSSIPPLEAVLQEFNERDVPSLFAPVGQIFVKHGVYNQFGLCMAHRHFGMSNNEILVETMREDKSLSVSIPWSFEGSSARPSDQAEMTSYGLSSDKKYVLPQNWVFSPAGELVPFEYVACDDTSLIPQPSQEFANELFAALKALGVEGIVGLRSFVSYQGLGSSWETTPKGSRANVVVFGEQPPEELKTDDESMVRVLWAFDKEGRLLAGEHWCVVCLYCGTCNKR